MKADAKHLIFGWIQESWKKKGTPASAGVPFSEKR